MNRTRALIICTAPDAFAHTRVREAAKHLLAQGDVSEEEKRLAEEALKSLQPSAEPTPSPRLKARAAAQAQAVRRKSSR